MLSGWFGRGPLSFGMSQLADRLRSYGHTTYHDWNDQSVISAVNAWSAQDKVAIVGFSLGANELGWMDKHFSRDVDLGVAYDPSRQSPLVVPFSNGEYVQRADKYKRFLCYYNPGTWFYGGSRYLGHQVETTKINMPHLMVQFDEGLHQKTLAAVKGLQHT